MVYSWMIFLFPIWWRKYYCGHADDKKNWIQIFPLPYIVKFWKKTKCLLYKSLVTFIYFFFIILCMCQHCRIKLWKIEINIYTCYMTVSIYEICVSIVEYVNSHCIWRNQFYIWLNILIDCHIFWSYIFILFVKKKLKDI